MRTLSCGTHVGSSSLTRDRTRAPCIGSTESYPLHHQGCPHSHLLVCDISAGHPEASRGDLGTPPAYPSDSLEAAGPPGTGPNTLSRLLSARSHVCAHGTARVGELGLGSLRPCWALHQTAHTGAI